MATGIKPWHRLSGRDFRFIYRRVPRLCVDLVIKDRRGILLIRRDIMPDRGRWHFPGGTIHFGETLEAAVRRFARDEVGLRVKVIRQIDAVEYFRGQRFGHIVSVVFLARPIAGKLHGSWQGRRVAFFRALPKQTVAEQRTFLLRHKLISRSHA